jgi:pimeloyl-ACP methyl ester carboxylesterase
MQRFGLMQRLGNEMRRLFILAAAVALTLTCSRLARADEFVSAGVKIHYVVQGQGEPVILIHGLGSSEAMNWGLPGIIAELAKQHRVIALDCRGHGQSDKPTAEGAYGTNMVEDVVRLMDHLHIARAQVVGYSMGGMIAMKLAVLHPECVTAMVLGGMGWHKADAPMNRFWERVGDNGWHNVPAACMREFPALAVSESQIKAVKMPVTIIVGDRDPCRTWYVQPLQKIRPDWPVHVIASAGHLNCILKPEFKSQLATAVNTH